MNAEAQPRQIDHTPGRLCREIHDQDKIIEHTEELYTELYDSEQNTIDMKNETATGNDHINIATLKGAEDTIPLN